MQGNRMWDETHETEITVCIVKHGGGLIMPFICFNCSDIPDNNCIKKERFILKINRHLKGEKYKCVIMQEGSFSVISQQDKAGLLN